MEINNRKITFAEQNQIDSTGKIATDFFDVILGMSVSECLITDESYLSDFSLCGLPDDATDDDAMSLEEMNTVWDKWVAEKIQKHYDVSIQTTGMTLVLLFSQIEQQQKASTH